MNIEFDTGNDAFREDAQSEAARILRDIAQKVESGHESGAIKDVNGNTIGRWFAGFADE